MSEKQPPSVDEMMRQIVAYAMDVSYNKGISEGIALLQSEGHHTAAFYFKKRLKVPERHLTDWFGTVAANQSSTASPGTTKP